jgi:hypothetical protein
MGLNEAEKNLCMTIQNETVISNAVREGLRANEQQIDSSVVAHGKQIEPSINTRG